MSSVSPSGPDFICIGAQKAGTTWLYENLREHPEIWLPPVKEIHYFNQAYPNPVIEPRETLPHPGGMKRYKLPGDQVSFANYRWLRNYYKLTMTDEWYQSLYSDRFKRGRLGGDITPAYSTLNAAGVEAVRALAGEQCRIFIILRDPVERAWSSLKMWYRWRGIDVQTANETAIISDLQRPGLTLRTQYRRMVDLWQPTFGERFGLFLYDQLRSTPIDFYHSVLRFLGLTEMIVPARIADRVWVDEKALPLPKQIEAFLQDYYCDELVLMQSLKSSLVQRPVG